jgi:ABC-type bacteriocin/lantibiotic exporter with double-glycine peptidase domain
MIGPIISTAMIICGIIALVCGAYAILNLIGCKKKRRELKEEPAENETYLREEDKKRNEKQMELFYNSARYKSWQERSEAAAPILNKFIKKVSAVSTALIILSVMVCISVLMPLTLGLVTELILVLIMILILVGCLCALGCVVLFIILMVTVKKATNMTAAGTHH